ncbi:MAG: hypothetical protein HRT67_02865 [Flavobacteriaceae bacterium]|nr:hypothetical protein [Flavobacteriaceae bacterium]
MASFRFHYRSTKDKGNISIRLIHKELDCVLATPYITKKEYWIYKTTKNGKSTSRHRKLEELKGGVELKQHKADLFDFKEKLENQLERDLNNGVPITKQWLKTAISENSSVLVSSDQINNEQERLNQQKKRLWEIREKNLLLNAIKTIYAKYGSNNDELKKFKTSYNWVSDYQDYKTLTVGQSVVLKAIDYNQGFIDDFKYWAIVIKKYKLSTAVGHLKRIKRAIKYAESIEQEGVVKLHRTINDVVYSTKREQEQQEDKIVIRLTFDEFDRIDNLDFSDNKELREVQKCMLIGGETGLRFTDFGKMNDKHLKTTLEGVKYWEFKTSKTKKWVQITKTERLSYFLKKYGNPKTQYSDNEDIFINKKMKEICRFAKINEPTEMEISRSVVIDNEKCRRYVRDVFPKYMGITTRSLRRSFATNYYGLMDSELIMRVTGHTDVKSLREYIDVHDSSIVAISFNKINEIHRKRATGLRKVD